MRLSAVLLLLGALTTGAYAQRPRNVDPSPSSKTASVPAPYGLNFPALFIKKKYRYLTINYEDPDTNLGGITSFKLSNKETVASVMNALASKAGLTQRGDGYVRKKAT